MDFFIISVPLLQLTICSDVNSNRHHLRAFLQSPPIMSVFETFPLFSSTPFTDAANPDVHLTCYEVKKLEGTPKFEKQHVLVQNQFGEDQILEVKKPELLCVPSTKEIIEE